MKRLLACLFAWISSCFSLFAAETVLLKMIPETTAGALYFNVRTLAQSDDCARWAHTSFFAGDKTQPNSGIEEFLIYTTSKPKVMNAALVRLSAPIDLAKNLQQREYAFSEGTMEGKRAFFVKNALRCEELVVIEMEPTLYLVAGRRRNAERLLKLKIAPAALTLDQVKQLPMPDAPIWYVDTGVRLPACLENGKKARGAIRMSFEPFGKDKLGNFVLMIDCPDATSASQVSVLIPMMSGVVCGVLFSDDPALTDRVLSRIVPEMRDNVFYVSADIPNELMHDIHNYFKTRDFVQMIQTAMDLSNI